MPASRRLIIEEVDGSPTGPIWKMVLSNASTTITGGVGTVVLGGVAGSTATIPFLINGAGSVIGTGVAGDLEIGFACTITAVRMLPDQSGSIVVDIKKTDYSGYAGSYSSICAAAKPTVSTATKSEDTTLTGWTTAIAAGNVLRFNVDSCTTITRCLISLTVTRS